jgi:imidazolonepropionase-like amidohydrolase
MVHAGMSTTQALMAATAVNAKIIRMQDEVGRIAPNLYADLIAVNGDPVQDIKVCRDVRFVMKAGHVYKLPS